ncbi:hypothetical protein CWB96_14315 [Pseudoalteromonas citrea]|uniref:Transposase DDE domain-containing protein n=1 Tax=Pseudoalteromonas citrea TaxID=43655 RepID=A0A5S3XNA5_9GAMM|nr:hypothetical protein CWB96_14315 [Pseudoalteromonas citrea]
MPLRALEGFVNSLLTMIDTSLQSPGYSCLCKRRALLINKAILNLKVTMR